MSLTWGHVQMRQKLTWFLDFESFKQRHSSRQKLYWDLCVALRNLQEPISCLCAKNLFLYKLLHVSLKKATNREYFMIYRGQGFSPSYELAPPSPVSKFSLAPVELTGGRVGWSFMTTRMPGPLKIIQYSLTTTFYKPAMDMLRLMSQFFSFFYHAHLPASFSPGLLALSVTTLKGQCREIFASSFFTNHLPPSP